MIAEQSKSVDSLPAAKSAKYPSVLSLSAGCLPMLVAFILRAYDLGKQSLWYDEAFSIYLSRMDLSSITARTAADIHPPLYYYLLHFWLQLTGSSEYAVRYLSLFFGVLTVPVLFKLADRMWGDRWPAIPHVVAWLACLSPAYVWYAQEARMYTLTLFLTSLGLYWYVRIVGIGRRGQQPGRAAYVVFVLASAAAAYAHFYALFVVAAEAIFAFGLRLFRTLPAGRPDRKRNLGLKRLLWLALSFVLIVLTYVPWSGYAFTRLETDTSYYQGTIELWPILRDTFTLFAAGHTMDDVSAGWAAIGLLALAATGLVVAADGFLFRRGERSLGPLVLVILSVAVPVLLLYSISYNRPKFHPRYLLLASPGYFMLIGVCLAATLQGALNRTLTEARRFLLPILFIVFSLVVATFWLQSLNGLYMSSKFERDDWRSVANYVQAHSRQNDAVILISGHAFPAFTYYYPGDNWTPVPDGFTLSTENTLGYNIANTLNRVLKGKERLWVVRWQADVVDPNGYLDRLLDEGAKRQVIDRLFTGIDLQLFAIPDGTIFNAEPKIANVKEVNFEDKLKLLGYEKRGEQTEKLAAASGSKVPLTLYWQATTTLDADYVVSLRVKDKDGHYWGRIDRRPANYFYPTQRWKPGEIVFGDYDVPVLAGTPPGMYSIEAEVYTQQGKGLASLNVLNQFGAPTGNASALAELEVTKSKSFPSDSQLQIPKTRQATFGDIELLGYEEIGKGEPLQQGASSLLMLFWKAVKQPAKNLDVVLQLADSTGAVFYEKRFPPASKDYPSTEWSAGEPIRAQYDLVIPPDAPAGEGQLRVGVADSSGMIGEPVTIQKVTISGRQRQMNVPNNIQHPQRADFGELVTFLGYDLDRDTAKPGSSVRLTLYWQAANRIDKSLAVFTHLLDKEEHMWGQKDSVPGGGASPTTSWVKGEVTKDVYDIPVKPDAPDGDLVIEIGMYDPASGQRLVVDGKDDRILLGHIRVAR